MPYSTTRRIAAVADAAARWCDADFPPRVRATRALERRTGYTEPVVDFALDALFGSIDAAALRATIAGELGSLDALDGFVARAGRPPVRYVSLPRATIVSSETTIGVAVPALVFAACAGCAVTVKERDDGLVAAFVATLCEEEPRLHDRIATAHWNGPGDDARSDAALGAADVVVAYGGDAALAAIAARLRPGARFVGYGQRTSVAYVTRETLADDGAAAVAASGIARDALLYDGEGCLSVHAVFVERGATTSPLAFARLLATACDAAATEFPAGFDACDPSVVAYRRAADFRNAQGAGALWMGRSGPHLVVLDPPHDEPPPLLRRTLALYSVAQPSDAATYLERQRIPLEGIALARDARAEVVAFAAATGAARIAEPGELQRPPLGGEHGGHGRILPFVRAIYRG